MEILVTASIGLVKDATGQLFLQVITANEENHYFLPISAKEATLISRKENVEISDFERTISLYTDLVIGKA